MVIPEFEEGGSEVGGTRGGAEDSNHLNGAGLRAGAEAAASLSLELEARSCPQGLSLSTEPASGSPPSNNVLQRSTRKVLAPAPSRAEREIRLDTLSRATSPPLPSLPPPSPSPSRGRNNSLKKLGGEMLALPHLQLTPRLEFDLGDLGFSGIPGLIDSTPVLGSKSPDELGNGNARGYEELDDDASTVTGTYRTALDTLSTMRQQNQNAKVDEFGSRKKGELPPPPLEGAIEGKASGTVAPPSSFHPSTKPVSSITKSKEKDTEKPKISYNPMPARRKSALNGYSPPRTRDNSPPSVPNLQEKDQTQIEKSKVSYNPIPARRKSIDNVSPPRTRAISLPTQKKSLSLSRSPSPELPPVYPLITHLTSLPLLTALLPHLPFADYLALSEITHKVKDAWKEYDFKEEILERYLGGVGYWRWRRIFGGGQLEVEEPLELSLLVCLYY